MLVGEFIGAKGAGAAFGAIGKGAGWTSKGVQTATKIATLTNIGMSAAGKGTEQALKEGANLQQASLYGLLVGATEAGTEMIGGVLTDIDSGLVGKMMRKTKTGNKILNNLVGNIIMNGISEGFEEVLSDVADPLWRKLTYDPELNLSEEYGSKEFLTGLLTSFTVGSLVGSIGSFHKAYKSKKFSINGKKIGAVGFQYFQDYAEVNTDFKERATLVFKELKAVEEAGHTFKEGTDTFTAIQEALNADDVSERNKKSLQKAYDKATKASNRLVEFTKEFDSKMAELGVTEEDLIEQYGTNEKQTVKDLQKQLGIEIISDTEDVIDEKGNVHVAQETQITEPTETPVEEQYTEPVESTTEPGENAVVVTEKVDTKARMAEAIVHNKDDLRNVASKFITPELTAEWQEKARQRLLEGKDAEQFARFNAANQIIQEITDGDKYYTTKEGLADLVSILEEAESIEEAKEMIDSSYEAKTDDRVNAGNKELIKTSKAKIPGRSRFSSGVESLMNKVIDSQYATRNTLKQLGVSESKAEQIIGRAVNSMPVGINKALNGFYHVEEGKLVRDSFGIYSSSNDGVVNDIQTFAKENGIEFDQALAEIEEALALEHEIDRSAQGKEIFGKYVNTTWVNKNFMQKMKTNFPELYEMFSRMQTYSQAEIDAIAKSQGELTEIQREILDEIANHYEMLGQEEITKKVNTIKEKYPIYDTVKAKLRGFVNQTLEARVKSGMMTREMADAWKKLYPNYVPTFRVIVGTGSAQSFQRIIGTDMKTAKGSNLVVQDIFSSVIRQAQFVNHFDAVNNVLNELYEGAKAFQERTGMYHENVQIISENAEPFGATSTEDIVELNRPQINGNTVYLYKDGNVITMQVSDTLLESLTNLDKGFRNNFSKLGVVKLTEKTVQTMRQLMTNWNPFFSWFRNPIKDIQSALIYSKNSTPVLLKNWGRSFTTVFAEAFGKGENTKLGQLYQVYIAEGGQASNIVGLNIYDDISYNEKSFKKTIRKLSTTVSNFNEVMENTTRFAEFISTYERLSKRGTMSENAIIQEALNDAREVTINFARKGTWTQVANKFIPFLTANIEGAARNIRAFISPRSKKELAAVILRMLILGLAPQIIQEIIYSGDEDYQSLSASMRSNYFLFKVGDEFIRIPKGYIQQAFSSAVVTASKKIHGEEVDKQDIGEMLENQWNAIGVDVNGLFFQPIIDAKNNRTWYGGEIVPQKYDNVRPSEQYDRDTSAIAKWLGKVTGWSPLKIDYVLDQMTGIVGDIILPATSENGYNPLKFLKDQFVSDPVYKNKWSNEFYTYKTEVNYDKTDGDAVSIVLASYLNSVSNSVSELKKMQTELETSDLSENEKAAQDRIIQATINTTYSAALENAEKLRNELMHYELSEESIAMDKIEAYRNVLGAEFALKSFNTRVYEKAKCYYKAGVSYDDFYVYYFSMRALPDRASVEKFIVKQRISPQLKNLLYCLMGYNIGNEKRKILERWLAQKGLTVEEIETIL